MLTLYTAIGNYRLTEKGLPLVTAGGRDCALDAHELLLWSSLAFRILTYQELRAEFYEKERELHILGELDFDHYLNRLPFRKALAVFHTEKLEPMEKQVLALLRHEMLSTAELIQCTEKGKTRVKDSSDLMDCLYRERDCDCESIVTDCRVSETRFPVLTAVANLYLKQQVTFQIL